VFGFGYNKKPAFRRSAGSKPLDWMPIYPLLSGAGHASL
jgi:hypothetical protein